MFLALLVYYRKNKCHVIPCHHITKIRIVFVKRVSDRNTAIKNKVTILAEFNNI